MLRRGRVGAALPLPPFGPRIWGQERKRRLGFWAGCENCEAEMGVGRGAYLSWWRPCAASSPAAPGGGGRGGWGARSVSASEGTTAVGPEARARGVVRSRSLQTSGLNFFSFFFYKQCGVWLSRRSTVQVLMDIALFNLRILLVVPFFFKSFLLLNKLLRSILISY